MHTFTKSIQQAHSLTIFNYCERAKMKSLWSCLKHLPYLINNLCLIKQQIVDSFQGLALQQMITVADLQYDILGIFNRQRVDITFERLWHVTCSHHIYMNGTNIFFHWSLKEMCFNHASQVADCIYINGGQYTISVYTCCNK